MSATSPEVTSAKVTGAKVTGAKVTDENVTSPPVLSVLAERLSAFITAAKTQTVPLPAVWAHATVVDPSLTGDPAARQRVADALTALAAAGLITMPARTPRGWDTRAVPPLPAWVKKPVRVKADPAPKVGPRVWPAPLAAAATLATRPDEKAMLARIAQWMRNNPNPPPVPAEERSVELFDDEKALTAAKSKRLFTSGALTLGLLGCYRTPLPFASQRVPGTGRTRLLIAENNATYHSLLTAARALPAGTRPDVHVAWGSGGQIQVSIESALLLDPAPRSLHYFGDLDVAGLNIAANTALAADALGLPPLAPVTGFYQWLLAHGRAHPDRSNHANPVENAAFLAWLPADLAPPVQALIGAGNRIAQETLGLRALREHPHLLTDALV